MDVLSQKLGKWINEELSSVSVVIVGDDTTFNEGLVAAMSPVLEYTPLCTAQLLKDLTGNTVQTIVDDEGADSLGETNRDSPSVIEIYLAREYNFLMLFVIMSSSDKQ